MILLKFANNKAFTYGAKQIFERAQYQMTIKNSEPHPDAVDGRPNGVENQNFVSFTPALLPSQPFPSFSLCYTNPPFPLSSTCKTFIQRQQWSSLNRFA
jgi:hypothetical protein